MHLCGFWVWLCLLFAIMRLLGLSHKITCNLLNSDLYKVLSLQQSVWLRTSCSLSGIETFTKALLVHPLGWRDTQIRSFVPHRKRSSSNTNSLRWHYRDNGKPIFTALPISDNPILRRSSEGANRGKVSLCQTEPPVCVHLTFRESPPRSHTMARQQATSAT